MENRSEKNNKVYLIGNAHIDIVWQWPWQDGLQEIKATFRSVLDRMNEYPDFRFTCAGALCYEWIENTDQAMFSEIVQRVKEGRWCIAGGWYLQPDCNIPCEEAFVREGLISQRYFREKFGVTAKAGYNVDSFGHNGGLPQILKKSGLDYYVFMRPGKHEKNLPSDLFDWVGQDGSAVKTFRIPFRYCIQETETLKKIKEFNSLPFAVKQVIMIYPKCAAVTDYQDHVVPSQIVRGYHTDGKSNIYSTIFYAEIPAYGYRTFKIFKEKRAETENILKTGADFLENEAIKVTFDLTTAGIKSIFDKKTGRELLSASTEIVTFNDERNDSWAHGMTAFEEETGKFKGAEMHVIEQGPARATMRMTAELNGSIVRQDFSIVPGGEEVFVSVRLNAREKHRAYRWKFPIAHGKNAHSVGEAAFGTVERELDGAEYPCGKWFAVYGESGGITVCNDGKYSYSADENAAYLTAIRTAIYLDHFANVSGTRDEFCDYIDLGETEFTFTLKPYLGTTDAVRAAYSLNRKVVAVAETFHAGPLGTEYCAIEGSEENIVATALKMSEDGTCAVLRAYECSGKETAAQIKLFGEKINASFGHNEIKTFKLSDHGAEETNLIEMMPEKWR